MATSFLELGNNWLKASNHVQEGIYWFNPYTYYQFYANYTSVPCEWDWNKGEQYFSIRPCPMKRALDWEKWTFEVHPIEIRVYRNQIKLINGDTTTSLYKGDGPQNELFKNDASLNNFRP